MAGSESAFHEFSCMEASVRRGYFGRVAFDILARIIGLVEMRGGCNEGWLESHNTQLLKSVFLTSFKAKLSLQYPKLLLILQLS